MAGGSSPKALCTVLLEIFRTYESLKLNLMVASKNTYIYHIFQSFTKFFSLFQLLGDGKPEEEMPFKTTS